MDSDEIDYLKGFTALKSKSAIAEAWDIIKEGNDGCPECMEKDRIIKKLLSGDDE